MMRALWAGVSGMKAHQVGLDVTSNNIANVNTTGFKSSRANFSDMLYQTQSGATLPYGGKGGTNAYSIGLGGEVNSTFRMHTQGSLKNTEWKGDLGIDGSGFFVVSGDGGRTRGYTRDGRFYFDTEGNLVNPNGFVVQGWIRNVSSFERTAAINDNVVDTSVPITSIRIDPKLVIPAKTTTKASVAVNLTSADTTDQLNFAYALDSKAHTTSNETNVQYDSTGKRMQVAENLGTLFTTDGNAMKLKQDQGIWVSYKDAEIKFVGNKYAPGSNFATLTQSIKLNGVTISFVNNSTATQITTRDAAITAINNHQDTTGIKAYVSGSYGIQLINTNAIDGDSTTKNIVVDTSSIKPQNPPEAQFFAQLVALIDDRGSPATKPITNSAGVAVGFKAETAFRYKYTEQTNVQLTSVNGRIFNTTEDLRRWMQYDANIQKNSHAVAGIANTIKAGQTVRISTYSLMPGETGIGNTQSVWEGNLANAQANSAWARLNTVSVTMNQYGQFEIINRTDGIKDDDPNAQVPQGIVDAPGNTNNLKITVANYQNQKTPSNILFGKMMNGISTGNLVEGGQSSSTSSFKMPKLATSFDIYDSLGNKHTLTIEFRKKSALEWTFSLKLPEPAEIVGASSDKRNVLEGGSVTFNRNGGLQSIQPNRFSFRPLNGAAGPQQVDLELGQNGITSDFLGITGTAEESFTRSYEQNGYASGTLKDYKFTDQGVMIGSFTNGKDLALAQVSLATFKNDSGLTSVGGNLFLESSNSGQAVIGEANKGGNGSIRAGRYELSTADLSEELTQLIVVQRGYQANAKSVTTSDQVLNTLLGLKQ